MRTKELESIFKTINYEWEYIQQQQQTYIIFCTAGFFFAPIKFCIKIPDFAL